MTADQQRGLNAVDQFAHGRAANVLTACREVQLTVPRRCVGEHDFLADFAQLTAAGCQRVADLLFGQFVHRSLPGRHRRGSIESHMLLLRAAAEERDTGVDQVLVDQLRVAVAGDSQDRSCQLSGALHEPVGFLWGAEIRQVAAKQGQVDGTGAGDDPFHRRSVTV